MGKYDKQEFIPLMDLHEMLMEDEWDAQGLGRIAVQIATDNIRSTKSIPRKGYPPIDFQKCIEQAYKIEENRPILNTYFRIGTWLENHIYIANIHEVNSSNYGEKVLTALKSCYDYEGIYSAFAPFSQSIADLQPHEVNTFIDTLKTLHNRGLNGFKTGEYNTDDLINYIDQFNQSFNVLLAYNECLDGIMQVYGIEYLMDLGADLDSRRGIARDINKYCKELKSLIKARGIKTDVKLRQLLKGVENKRSATWYKGYSVEEHIKDGTFLNSKFEPFRFIWGDDDGDY